MDILEHERVHRGEPARLGANRPRGAAALFFATAFLVAVASTTHLDAAHAQPPTKDVWQTYLDAAQASDSSGNFTAEAIILSAALALANKSDPHGQRPALTRLPLILAYGELHRTDLMDPLSALSIHIDVGNLDERYDDFLNTIDEYANSYHDRWNAHQDDSPSDDLNFKQGVRFYGAKNSFLIEIAFRTKLRPGDQIGLAKAVGVLGVAYRKHGYLDCAGYDYGVASQSFQDFRQRLNAMATAASRFDVGSLMDSAGEQSTLVPAQLDTQVALLDVLERYMQDMAYNTIHPNAEDRALAKTDWGSCDPQGPPLRTPLAVGFDAQISSAIKYVNVRLSLIQQLSKYWPDNNLFGLAAFRFAVLYKLEYDRSQQQPGAYPDVLAQARSAYQNALKILTHAAGPNAELVSRVASDYATLLVEAKLPDEAKKIETQYGVKPSN